MSAQSAELLAIIREILRIVIVADATCMSRTQTITGWFVSESEDGNHGWRLGKIHVSDAGMKFGGLSPIQPRRWEKSCV